MLPLPVFTTSSTVSFMRKTMVRSLKTWRPLPIPWQTTSLLQAWTNLQDLIRWKVTSKLFITCWTRLTTNTFIVNHKSAVQCLRLLITPLIPIWALPWAHWQLLPRPCRMQSAPRCRRIWINTVRRLQNSIPVSPKHRPSMSSCLPNCRLDWMSSRIWLPTLSVLLPMQQ